MATDADQTGVRLSEVVAALSLGIDLGFGQPMEHVLRQCLIALRLAEELGVDDQTRESVYYAALLVNVGCHSDAHEQAKWFGDDIALKATKYTQATHGVRSAVAGLRMLGSGTESVLDRWRVGLEFAVSGHRDLSAMIEHHASMARRLGDDLGLSAQTLDALETSYEQWDGKGWPGQLRGDEVPIAARLAVLGEFTEVAHRLGGVDAARSLVRRQRGKLFDPRLTDALDTHAEILLSGLDAVDTWDAVIAAEPALMEGLSGDRLDAALVAVADFVDLKSPYSLGHARAVADLAAEAGTAFGLPTDEVRTLYRAGLVHCFGKLGVSNTILDKPGPLGAGERERVRMIPYLTERMLRQSPGLASLATVAVQYGERLDGSGFPRSLVGGSISRSGRLLGAAHAYRSLREPRAHREAVPADRAAATLRAEVRSGRLDPEAVEAVLRAAGHRAARRRAGPAGLTPREIDVLRLLARGLSNKEVAERLAITRKTVANHVEHIYAKIGASSRAGAALFATRHGLLDDEERVPV